jgi:hypothetical protein
MLAIDFHTWCKNSRKIMALLSVICTLILFRALSCQTVLHHETVNLVHQIPNEKIF